MPARTCSDSGSREGNLCVLTYMLVRGEVLHCANTRLQRAPRIHIAEASAAAARRRLRHLPYPPPPPCTSSSPCPAGPGPPSSLPAATHPGQGWALGHWSRRCPLAHASKGVAAARPPVGSPVVRCRDAGGPTVCGPGQHAASCVMHVGCWKTRKMQEPLAACMASCISTHRAVACR